LIRPAFDLIVYFDDGLSLKRVFCDETNQSEKEEEFDNYSFFTPKLIYTVTCRSGLDVESNS